ncbi:MAG: dTDP-6-deoxy-3,4-keto-hexulose isomerase FdtA [Sphingobacteriaceae bacterium]|nr:dTDP-6-deoxy-3,4-keto-hexulose isomerase FdtA [Sphingobacteriaceae bacterium]
MFNDIPHLFDIGKVGSSALGYISVAEKLPFKVKRVYWTYYAPHEVVRGHHAHKELQQLIFAIAGSIEFELEDTSGKQYFFKIDKPNEGVYIPRLFWRTIKFSHNAVLLCLASMEYSEDDYIRDYAEFKSFND